MTLTRRVRTALALVATAVASACSVAPDGGPAAPDAPTPGGGAPGEAALAVSGSAAASQPDSVDEAPRPQREPVRAERPRIEGVVILPAGTPRDERVAVVLLGTLEGDEDDPDGDAELDYYTRELARAGVAGDGSFALELPLGFEEGELDLRARFVYLRHTHAVGPHGAFVRLEAMLGGHARIRLVPPSGSRLDPRALVGRTLLLSRWCAPLSTGPRRWSAVRVGSDLVIAAGGLAPECQHPLLAADWLSPFAPARLWLPPVAAGAVATLDLSLCDGLTVRGRVLDSAGAPVADARLEAGRGARAPRTDAHGRFALAGLHPTGALITVTRAGYLPAVLEPRTSLEDALVVLQPR